MDENNKKLSELEALLFQYGDPIKFKKISNILDVSKQRVSELLNQYEIKLKENESRGLMIIKNDSGAVQLVTKPDLSYITEELAKEEFSEELTPAVLEVLTIVAYLGPVTRADIDFIRGVNSSYTLRRLLMRGLIERKRKGRTYEYETTFDFLKHLGIEKVEDLPDYEKYHDILEEYETKVEEQS